MAKNKKGKIEFDEYFNNGLFEMGRLGNIISMKNHLTPEDIEKNNELIAGQYNDCKTAIDNKIRNIVENIQKCNPLDLLLYTVDRAMSNMVNTVSETQIKGEKNFELRVTEYVQSILVSQSSNYKNNEIDEELMQNVFDEIVELHIDIINFYFVWAAKMSIENNELTLEDIEYIMEAQLTGSSRGYRYQFQQTNVMEKLLLPHSEKIYEVYGITIQSLIEGLNKLEYSLSSEKFDCCFNLFNEWQNFRNEAEGKSFEEIKLIMGKIRSSRTNAQNLSKMFGADLYDVKKVTGWSDILIDSLSWELGECDDFFGNSLLSGWPVIDLPVQKRPFIKIEGVSYCFDYYNLFDNFYRIIQKNIKKHDDKYTDKWSQLQQEASEMLVKEQFEKLLPKCTSYIGNYYPKNKSLKSMEENDLIILYDDTLIIAEVKAGSFTYTPAITDYVAHKKSFSSLIEKADFQCERTLNYVKNNEESIFYDNNKNIKFRLNNINYSNIYTMCITVDNFNVFEAKIEKTHFLKVSDGTIAISSDDLEVYTEYFKSPLYFLHYLKHRRLATMTETLMLNDELDHLGMYITHNAYKTYVDEFKDTHRFNAIGYREDLDSYFAGLHNKKLRVPKPEQDVPQIIRDIISFISEHSLKGRVGFSNFLLDIHPDDRKTFSEGVSYQYKRQIETKSMFPIICNGDVMYGCFVKQDGIEFLSEDFRLKYMYANMLKVEKLSSWYIVLTFDDKQLISDIEYKELKVSDIDDKGYDRNELKQIADMVYENRIKSILSKNKARKIGRNELCPCGSGKKYKKCCLNKQ